MFFKSCTKILILTLMVLMLVQNINTFEHSPEKDLINSSNLTTGFQYSSINNISSPELNEHEHIDEDEINDKEIRSSSLLNGQFTGLTENGTNEENNEFETADENMNTDYVIKNRKESASQSFIQTTMVPEYIQNHKIYDGEGGLYYELAIGEQSDSTSSIQTAINESKPFLIKTNILLPNKQPKYDHVLETLNRSDEEVLNGANHEELEQIQTSGLIGTTLTPKLSPVASTATTYTTPSFLSISTTSVVVAPTTTLRTKQGKQIQINRLLPHEQLRNYFEDAYIRMPLAVIIDPSSNSLERTKILWRDALRKNFSIKIVLVSLNASGVPTAYNFNNTRQFLAGLNSIKENSGGNAFVGIIQASELVPYDSAIFISTALIPQHTDLVHDAAITLLKKRIRLYLVWYGERSLSENETQEATGGILGEVAIRSGGEILQVIGSENSQELDGNTATLIADTYRGSQDIEIPVDTTLSSLHIKIDSMMRSATLETPNGG